MIEQREENLSGLIPKTTFCLNYFHIYQSFKIPHKKSSSTASWRRIRLSNILIAVFLIVITLVLNAFYRRKKSSRNGILLIGLCDSGKTLMFSHPIHTKHVQTHTSIKKILQISFLSIFKDMKVEA